MRLKKTNMTVDKSAVRRLAWALLSSICGLALVGGLLLFARTQVRAKPIAEALDAPATLTKRANTGVAQPGDTLTYSIRIERGEAEVRLGMTDELPQGLSLITESLRFSGKGSYGWTGNTVTWTSSSFGLGNFAVVTFSAEISPQLEGEVTNTAEVTGTGELVTASWKTNIVSGLLNSQIRLPNMDAYITEKGSLNVSGIAWQSGMEPPYLTDDAHLSLLKVNEMNYYAQWTPVIAADDYILQESTGRNFGSLTLNESVGDTSYLVSKVAGEEGTYYYRVQAVDVDTESRTSRWSNVVSVTVPWTEASQVGATSALAWTGTADDAATVQVRAGAVGEVESSQWQTAIVTATGWGWEWSYDWPLPRRESTQYLIQSRASEDGESFGSIDTITVTLDNAYYLVYLPRLFRRWPPVPFSPSLDQIENQDKRVDYQVSWSYDDDNPDVPDPTSYTLQEARDQAFTNPTSYDVGSAKIYQITDAAKEKTGGTYYYRVRGHNAYGPGGWSNIRSTAVRVLPYAPKTLSVYDPNQDGDITVNWTYGYDYPPVTSYTLQEAMDASFTVDVRNYAVVGTSKELGDREDGTYYRVRAHNDYGAGDWSDPISIVVDTGLRDDFDDPDSGWEVRRTSSPDLDNMELRYKNGELHTKSDDRWDFGLFSPLVEAPAMPYRITMKTKLKEGVDAPGYGIVFRAKRGDFCPVDRDDAEDNDGCFSHYFRLNVTIDPGNHIRYNVKRIEDHDERGRADGKDLSDGYDDIDDKADWNGWNTWEIEVREEWFRISVNGEQLGTYWDDSFADDRLFGILTSCYEYNPAEFRHEYFYVESID